MINFDWSVMKDQDMETIITILYALSQERGFKKFGRNVLKVIKDFKDDSSFLMNEMPLIVHRNSYADSDIKTYLALASMRSYDYLSPQGSMRLPTYYLALFGLEGSQANRLILNPLLQVTSKEILFKYEEEFLGENSIWQSHGATLKEKL